MRIGLILPGHDIAPSTSANPVRRWWHQQAADILHRTPVSRSNWALARTAKHLIEALDLVETWEARARAAEQRGQEIEAVERQVEILSHTLHVIAAVAASPSTERSAIVHLSKQVLALTPVDMHGKAEDGRRD